jgi:hypothetical protein
MIYRALFKLEVMRVDLPAIDIEDPFQMSSLFAFLSKRGNQSTTCNLVGL